MSVEAASYSASAPQDSRRALWYGRVDRDVDEFFHRKPDAADGPKLTFDDFVDTINPLQHIPVVNDIYRDLTGDQISPHAKMAGGTLYGGPVGMAMSAFSMIFEQTTGDSVTGKVMTAMGLREETGPGTATAPASAVAQNDPFNAQFEAATRSFRRIDSAPIGSAAINGSETVFVTPSNAAVSAPASMQTAAAQVAVAPAAPTAADVLQTPASVPTQTAAPAPASGTIEEVSAVPVSKAQSFFTTTPTQQAAIEAAEAQAEAGTVAAAQPASGRSAFMEDLMQNRGFRSGAVSLSAEQRVMANDALKATNAAPALMQQQAAAAANVPQDGIPTLSEGSMDAILKAFGQTPQPRESDVVTSQATGQSARVLQPAADPFAMMQQALDRYQSMKGQEAGSVVKQSL